MGGPGRLKLAGCSRQGSLRRGRDVVLRRHGVDRQETGEGRMAAGDNEDTTAQPGRGERERERDQHAGADFDSHSEVLQAVKTAGPEAEDGAFWHCREQAVRMKLGCAGPANRAEPELFAGIGNKAAGAGSVGGNVAPSIP